MQLSFRNLTGDIVSALPHSLQLIHFPPRDTGGLIILPLSNAISRPGLFKRQSALYSLSLVIPIVPFPFSLSYPTQTLPSSLGTSTSTCTLHPTPDLHQEPYFMNSLPPYHSHNLSWLNLPSASPALFLNC